MVRIAGRLLYPLLDTPRRRKQAYRHLGTATQRVFERTQKATYITMLMERKLNNYLFDIDNQAQKRLETLVEQMKQAQGITEQLESENALEWVQRLNNIQACAKEIVEKEIIFA